MINLRRVPVIAPNGYKFILVVNGIFIDAMEDGSISEIVPEGSIVAIEECDQDLETFSYYSFNPTERERMSFSVRTPEGCICKMPDAVKDVEDLKLGEVEPKQGQIDLLEVGKKAAIEALESGKIGNDEAGFTVSISGHASEPAGIGDTLNIGIMATTATDPPQRN